MKREIKTGRNKGRNKRRRYIREKDINQQKDKGGEQETAMDIQKKGKRQTERQTETNKKETERTQKERMNAVTNIKRTYENK